MAAWGRVLPDRADDCDGQRSAGHHQILRARHHPLRDKMHGLLAGAALAVDGGGRHMGRQACGQPGQAARRAGLLAGLAHAAGDHIVHRAGVDAVALHELLQHLAEQIDGVELGQDRRRAALLHALDDVDELLQDAITAICDRAFIGDDDAPRTEKAFNEQKARARTRLPAVTQAVTSYLNQIAAEYQALLPKLQKHRLGHELTQQLGRLLYKGFLTATPWSQLPQLPRYMKAMSLRMDKQPANAQRDGQRGAEIRDLWQKWDARMAEENERGGASLALQLFRWHIEELRVGLFAQEAAALVRPQPRVEAPLREKASVVAFLDDAAVMHDDDATAE